MENGFAATIGFFDGVHRGHRCLIRQLCSCAAKLGQSTMLITFDQHPRQVLHSDYIPQLLSTLPEKEGLLRSTGVNMLHVMHFTPQMAALSASEFMMEVLRKKLNVKTLVMGYDHKFGRDGGTFLEYVTWGEKAGIHVVRAEEIQGERISSSVIRRHIMQGEVTQANDLLGYNYSISGTVVQGHQLGRQIGFPTANVSPSQDKLLPGCGVYAVRVQVETECYDGMLCIGHRPTVQNGDDLSVEVNLFGFEGDLYGKTLSLEIVDRLRAEVRFSSVEALQAQLVLDAKQAMQCLAAEKRQ